MDWTLDLNPAIDREAVQFVRDTLEARVKAESGQYGEAARILWELLIELRHRKDKQRECITMVHMGKVYRALRWSIAVSLFEDALELAEDLGFTLGKLLALVELGEIKCHWGQFEESLDLFEKALTLLEDDDLVRRRIVLLDIVIAHEGLDDLKRCVELLKKVLEIDKLLEMDHLIADPDIDEDRAHLERLSRQS
jgi:tetratricopeptide (TPR) repeat protein